MPGAFQYTGRLQRALVLGGGSAELQRKASRFHGVKEYFEHVDRVHDRMLLMLRLALHDTWELGAEGGGNSLRSQQIHQPTCSPKL